jgi:hypothetical protein
MKSVGERSIASFVRIVLDAVWWLSLAALPVLIGLLIFCFRVRPADNNLTLSLPVAMELQHPVHNSAGSSGTDARIEKVRGNLLFPVQDSAFLCGDILLIGLLLGFSLWGLNQLRHVFRSLSRGLLFIPENARRIRWLGFVVLLGEVARAAVVYFWSYYTSLHFTAEGLRFVPSIDFSGTTILAGLAILVIAEVFREGTRLHEEQSLTI